MPIEVRYHMLRPAQIVARRKECPAVYIPLGNLEWHGPHSPPGVDALQAEALAILCAQKGGGLAFPALYYGESRSEALMEANDADHEQIAAGMELPPENFSPARQPFGATDQALNYQRLLLHILAEAETLGFKVGVLIAGHYPLIDHARAAALLFNKRQYSRYHGMLAWACLDYLLARDRYPKGGDHAGGWETSHMMALHPETVDLGALPPRGSKYVGIHCDAMDPHDANPQFGRETLEYAAEKAVLEVKRRLENRPRYNRHGESLTEGP